MCNSFQKASERESDEAPGAASPAAPPAPKPPAVGGIAGTHDPNYQTLAGVGGDIFGADKKGGGDAPNLPLLL
ncbi:hypothetical protein COOONC_18289 [Cooperia oncophora]